MPSLLGSVPVRIIAGAEGTAPLDATSVKRRLVSIEAVGASSAAYTTVPPIAAMLVALDTVSRKVGVDSEGRT